MGREHDWHAARLWLDADIFVPTVLAAIHGVGA